MKRFIVFITLFVLIFSYFYIGNLNFPAYTVAQTKESTELSGFGQKATEKFALKEGLVIFEMTHNGGSNFAIKLLDSQGDYVDLLVNEIGAFNGSKAVRIENEGNYLLDITADGKWTVKINQSKDKKSSKIPLKLEGVGQKASDFFTIGKGLATFEMIHNGSSNFAIKLLDENGEYIDLLVNEIGVFNGSKATKIPYSGVYLLDITADGSWSVAIKGEQPKKEDLKAGENGKKSNEGCFIATAAYGTSSHEDLKILRKFRDDILLTNDTGKVFVQTYYLTSPPIADFISDKPVLRVLTREFVVKPIVEALKQSASGN